MNWHVDRLSQELHKELGWAIANSMRDPRIPPLVTITEIRLAPDCRDATVFVSMFCDESEKDSAVSVLNKSATFLQHVISERIAAKFLPRLHFKKDKTIEQSERINDLLHKIDDDVA